MQLLLDVLMTDGHPSVAPAVIPQPHLPILACNMDLQWMAEAPMVGWIFSELGGKNTDHFISLTLVFFSAKIWSWSLPAVC